jgi:DNA-binding beta-propeller fold protein YncE
MRTQDPASLSRAVTALRARLRRGIGPIRATALLAAVLAACAAPQQPVAGVPDALYVANGHDGTVSQLDSATGRPLGPPLPAGPSPWRIAPGADGSLLALSIAQPHGGHVTHVRRSGRGWEARQVAVEYLTRDAFVAGDGGRYVAIAYRASGAGAASSPANCRLALLDTVAGTVTRTYPVCAAHESLAGLAFENGPAGPVAYLGVHGWASPEAGGPGGGPSGGPGRVIAIDAGSGAVQAVLFVAGAPTHLTLAPAPGRTTTRLYCLVTVEDQTHDPPIAYHARLLGLNPASLDVESERPLGFWPRRLVVAPDGDHVYALLERSVVRLALADPSGAGTLAVPLPGIGFDLAVTRDRLYVSNAFGSELWAFDRRRNWPARPVPVGHHPMGMAFGRTASGG